ncbi:MAG: efflux RND transporter permease subunit, partial [Armatimonadetes bacterium]|nr:efflux RND transporter permease subunit [Armatimonadota bacterium]
MADKNDTKSGGAQKIVQWSVDHPYAVISFFLATLLLGYLAVTTWMPRRFMPYVETPMIGIVTQQPGLSAEEMETYFSGPIEQKMIGIQNVRFIRSVSQDGFSMVVLEFEYGYDMQKAYIETQALMDVVQGELPKGDANQVPSFIVKVDPMNLPILTLSLSGDEDMGWDMASLRDLADNQLINRFKTAHGNVYSVTTFGGYRRQLQIRVDRDKAKSYGISIIDVRNAIDKYNVARSAGHITQDDSEPILRVDTLAKSAAMVREYPIRADGDRVVRVGDIAEVLDTYVEERSAYRHMSNIEVDGEIKSDVRDAIAVHILQNPDASSPVTIEAVNEIIADLEKEYPGIHFEVAYNNASFVEILFENMVHELVLAIVLTGLLVLFFLGDIRGTLIALTAIPVSMAMTLLAMAPLGFSLNSSTLIGLLIAIGRLVDDAIIGVHAVERHMRMGKDRRTATIDGISEVLRSVLAGTIVLVIMLIPLLLSG